MPSASFAIALRDRADVNSLCARVALTMANAGFGRTDVVKFRTAASKIAQNAVRYGGGGEVKVSIVKRDNGVEIHLTITDQGPGIADLGLAMKPGFSTGGTLGLGLSGARNLVDDFAIWSSPGAGTCITIAKLGNLKS